MIKIQGDTWDWTQCLILGFILIFGYVVLTDAQEDCLGDTCALNESITTPADNFTLNETETCKEQLNLLLNEYNNLTEDYHSGANCGTVRYMLIDNNAKLSSNYRNCTYELGVSDQKAKDYEGYKFGFWFLFGVDILVGGWLLYHGFKKSKE